MTKDEVYLGDGLYASFDGFAIWLRAPRGSQDDFVALEPQVYHALVEYHTRLTGKTKETDTMTKTALKHASDMSNLAKSDLFYTTLRDTISSVRERLASCETISGFQLQITASGRTHDGSVQLQFELSDNTYGSKAVVGNSLEAVLQEVLHRHGWEKRQKPLELTFAGDAQQDEQPAPGEAIPF